jgi:hypothetical protein
MLKVNIDLDDLLKKATKKAMKEEVVQLIEELRDATPVDTGKARDGWYHKDGKIMNDVEYIDELNAGSSKQAPSHFIEKTLLEHRNVNSNGTIVVPK